MKNFKSFIRNIGDNIKLKTSSRTSRCKCFCIPGTRSVSLNIHKLVPQFLNYRTEILYSLFSP